MKLTSLLVNWIRIKLPISQMSRLPASHSFPSFDRGIHATAWHVLPIRLAEWNGDHVFWIPMFPEDFDSSMPGEDLEELLTRSDPHLRACVQDAAGKHSTTNHVIESRNDVCNMCALKSICLNNQRMLNIPNHAQYSQTQYSNFQLTLVDARESTLAKAAPKDSALRLVCLGFQQSSRCKESMQCWKCCMMSHWGIGALARSAKPGSDRSLTFMTCTRFPKKIRPNLCKSTSLTFIEFHRHFTAVQAPHPPTARRKVASYRQERWKK